MNIISATGISKRYGDVLAVDNVSIELREGDICGYIGPNGAGKTTTVKMLAGITKPDSGSITVAGKDVVNDPDAVKPLYGYVPENGAVYESLSANEYLLFAGRMHGLTDDLIQERAGVLLEYFGIAKEADDIMSGYSKGMKQKVLLCTAMVHQPDIYFFDEPLNGLDANATLLFKELIRQIAARGKTIMYCSHLLDTVERLCNKIIVIENGATVAEGTIEELRSRTGHESLDEVFSSLTRSENRIEKTTDLLNVLDTLQS